VRIHRQQKRTDTRHTSIIKEIKKHKNNFGVKTVRFTVRDKDGNKMICNILRKHKRRQHHVPEEYAEYLYEGERLYIKAMTRGYKPLETCIYN